MKKVIDIVRSHGPEFEAHLEKMVYSRVNALLSDRVLMSIYTSFGADVFLRSSALYGLDEFCRECSFSGGTCVEIGTYNGITAAILSRYFRKVISIDIVDTKLKHDVKKLLTNEYDLPEDRIEFITIENNKQKAEYLQDIQFDAAYLDGDHKNDTIRDFDLVRQCGNVMFHEYWPCQPGVFDLVNLLPPTVVSGGINFAHWRLVEPGAK
jgi:hypothetical protein